MMASTKTHLLLFVVFILIPNYVYMGEEDEETILDVQQIVLEQMINNLEKEQPEAAAEAKMSLHDLIKHHGYTVENHELNTPDGYVLALHRILPRSKVKRRQKGKYRPVLIMHGIHGSSADWIISGGGNSLAYHLVNNGYDVWLGNFRGNVYSKAHTKYKPDLNAEKFWDFSFHEMGVIDLATMIDHILDKTNQKKLFNIGYALGATAFYVLMSEKPEYNDKIASHFSLAPIIKMKEWSMLIDYYAQLLSQPKEFDRLVGKYEYKPLLEVLNRAYLYERLCTVRVNFGQYFCGSQLFVLTQMRDYYKNTHVYPFVFKHTLSATSTKLFRHYLQIKNNSHEFRKYDYGKKKNLEIYGSEVPPEYKLKNVKAPIIIIYSNGGNDALSGSSDVESIKNDVGSDVIHAFGYDYDHMDYIYKDELEQIKNSVLGFMNMVNSV